MEYSTTAIGRECAAYGMQAMRKSGLSVGTNMQNTATSVSIVMRIYILLR